MSTTHGSYLNGVMVGKRGKEKSKRKGTMRSYQKDKRDILKFVPKLRKVKKKAK